MPAATCNACNLTFADDESRGQHYRSEWHRYNLKRKVAGLPGVTEQWFEKWRQALVVEEPSKERLLYRCQLCGKDYSSSQAYANHLLSRIHLSRAAADPGAAAAGPAVRPAPLKDEEVDNEVEMEDDGDGEVVAGEGDAMEPEWEVEHCLFCDERVAEGEVAACVEHMHRRHGFFLPEAERLRDPHGLLQYLGLKVSMGHMCLYCDERSRQYASLEAVRRHMADRAHCKLRWGDGSGLAEAELEEFYDFSAEDGNGERAMLAVGEGEPSGSLELVTSGEELRVASALNGDPRVIGSRDFARYYRQKPRPDENRDSVLANVLVAKYRSMGLSTRQGQGLSKKQDIVQSRAEREQAGRRGHQVQTHLSSSSAHWGR